MSCIWFGYGIHIDETEWPIKPMNNFPVHFIVDNAFFTCIVRWKVHIFTWNRSDHKNQWTQCKWNWTMNFHISVSIQNDTSNGKSNEVRSSFYNNRSNKPIKQSMTNNPQLVGNKHSSSKSKLFTYTKHRNVCTFLECKYLSKNEMFIQLNPKRFNRWFDKQKARIYAIDKWQ